MRVWRVNGWLLQIAHEYRYFAQPCGFSADSSVSANRKKRRCRKLAVNKLFKGFTKMPTESKRMFGIRLADWQVAELERAAQNQSITPTALARSFVVAGLNSQTLHERELLELAQKDLAAKAQISKQIERLEWVSLGVAQTLAAMQKVGLGEVVSGGKKASKTWAEKREASGQNEDDGV